MKCIMSQKVFLQNNMPDFSTIPFSVLKEHPFEKGSHRPYCQIKLCVSPKKGFMFNLLAFEKVPVIKDHFEEDSLLSFVLAPKENMHDSFLWISVNAEGKVYASTIKQDGEILSLDASLISCIPFSGSDLQGEYWSVIIVIPPELIESIFGEFHVDNGDVFMGNFYMSLFGETPHFACLFPYLSDTPKLLSTHSLGELNVTKF